MKKLVSLSLALSFISFATAHSQTGAEGFFTIHNNTSNNIVVGFYTNDGSGWSENWLSERLNPGEEASAEFFADSGACDQILQVGWLGDDGGEVLDEEISIDICEASNLYLEDNNVSFD